MYNVIKAFIGYTMGQTMNTYDQIVVCGAVLMFGVAMYYLLDNVSHIVKQFNRGRKL